MREVTIGAKESGQRFSKFLEKYFKEAQTSAHDTTVPSFSQHPSNIVSNTAHPVWTSQSAVKRALIFIMLIFLPTRRG